jgi:hypothetical protein
MNANSTIGQIAADAKVSGHKAAIRPKVKPLRVWSRKGFRTRRCWPAPFVWRPLVNSNPEQVMSRNDGGFIFLRCQQKKAARARSQTVLSYARYGGDTCVLCVTALRLAALGKKKPLRWGRKGVSSKEDIQASDTRVGRWRTLNRRCCAMTAGSFFRCSSEKKRPSSEPDGLDDALSAGLQATLRRRPSGGGNGLGNLMVRSGTELICNDAFHSRACGFDPAAALPPT